MFKSAWTILRGLVSIPLSPLFPILLLSLYGQKHAPHTKNTFKKQYDYIVVGAGSAGSALAARLSELECVSVLLLEAGQSPPILTEVPVLAGAFMKSGSIWAFETEPQRYTAEANINRRVPIPVGKTLGGTSTINGMVFNRGNPHNYDSWAKDGAHGWSYREAFPYFLKMEDNTDPKFINNGYHAEDGPLTISTPKYQTKIKEALMESAKSLKYEFTDASGPVQHGFYDMQLTQRDGQRCSTAKAYLVPAEHRPNLDILVEALVTKINFEENRAVGVEFEFQGLTRSVSARGEVLVCAGALNTPKLLMLSGVGPTAELSKLNISTVVNLPVGLNLQDHYGNAVGFVFNNSVKSFTDELFSQRNMYSYIKERKGFYTLPFNMMLTAFLKNRGSGCVNRVPDHQLYFLEADCIFARYFGMRSEYAELYRMYEHLPTVFCLSHTLHPKSRGTVRLRSKNPHDPPLIDPLYYQHPDDMEDVIEGMKVCLRFLSTPSMTALGAERIRLDYPGCPTLEEDLDSHLNCSCRSLLVPGSHFAGTAKMGYPCDPTAVVDHDLRVIGVRGLRVVDASVMPTIVTGNPNIPIIMIAEKAADIIKRSLTCHR